LKIKEQKKRDEDGQTRNKKGRDKESLLKHRKEP
jgi:hypothetical protein